MTPNLLEKPPLIIISKFNKPQIAIKTLLSLSIVLQKNFIAISSLDSFSLDSSSLDSSNLSLEKINSSEALENNSYSLNETDF